MITEKAYAKVNLFINVLESRHDGYHDLKMINAKIDLADTIKISETDCPGLAIIESNDLFLSNQNNIVHDVATHMIQVYRPQKGIRIEIDKKIPFGAGLAGNSTDAASIIKGVDKLFGLNLSFEEMIDIGSRYGADIPYCLVDHPAIVEGVGEKLTKVDLDLSPYKILLVNPRVYVATKEIFTVGNRKGFDNVDDQKILKALQKKDIVKFVDSMHNALQKISVENNEVVAEAEKTIKEHLGERGLVMTGSGSTFVKFLLGDETGVDEFIATYRAKYFINIYQFL